CSDVNESTPTYVYTLSLHDALPILSEKQYQYLAWDFLEITILYNDQRSQIFEVPLHKVKIGQEFYELINKMNNIKDNELFTLTRSEEHTSELQSRENLVCRLLLEKK